MATSFISLATFGRCSQICMPGTAVSIGLNVPPLAWPGFMSKVSIWLGPPLIHSKMHARFRAGSAAALAASDSIQPEAENAEKPAAASFIQSRLETLEPRSSALVRFMSQYLSKGRRSSRRG